MPEDRPLHSNSCKNVELNKNCNRFIEIVISISIASVAVIFVIIIIIIIIIIIAVDR
jgi:hypothetical protein